MLYPTELRGRPGSRWVAAGDPSLVPQNRVIEKALVPFAQRAGKSAGALRPFPGP